MEKSSSVKVVGYWVSMFVHRVRWALKLKGVEYEYVEEDLFNRTSLLSQINPVHGKVPVLIHHGNPLPESTIILEYIDQVWSHNPLLPPDPFHRAQARFWANFVDTKIIPAIIIALYSEGEEQERAVKFTIEGLEKIEETMVGKKKQLLFGGERLGYMDLILGFIAYMVPIWEEVLELQILDPSRFPAIVAWTHNFLDNWVIKGEYLPPKDGASAFYTQKRKEIHLMLASNPDFLKKLWINLMK